MLVARGEACLVVGQMGEVGQEVQRSKYKTNQSWDVRYSMVTIVSNIVMFT